jgi:sugar diacid utilization regulator
LIDLATQPQDPEHDAPVTASDEGPVDPTLWMDAALDEAWQRATTLLEGEIVVGISGGGGFEAIRTGSAVPADVPASLLDVRSGTPAGAPGGRPFEPLTGPSPGWWASRHPIGEAREVILAVSAEPDPLASARLQTLALDLARTVLVHEAGHHREQLGQLLTTARRVAESLDLDTVLASIVEDATDLLGADSGDILLWDRAVDRLRVVAVANFPPDMLGFELVFGEGLSSQAIVRQETITVPDYARYEHAVRALDQYDFGSVMCAPLLFRGEAIGAINVHARGRRHHFDPGADDLLAAFAGHAAIAIDHARRYQNEVKLGRDLADSNAQLTRLLTVQQRLAAHVLVDGSPAGIATVLAEDLGREVAIQDDVHRLIAGAAPDGGEGWRELVATGVTNGSNGSGPEPFTVAVRVGQRVAGYLLLSSAVDLGPIDRALVDAATTGVALAFAKVRAATEVEERLRGEAVADLLTGSYPSEEGIARRAARLGSDLGQPHDLLVIRAGEPVIEGPGSGPRDDEARRGLDAVRERLATLAPRSLAVLHAGLIVVLVDDAHPGGRDARSVGEELKTFLEARVDAGPVTVVVADRCGRPDDYAPAFRLAAEALDLLEKLGRRGTVVSTSALGPYRLLLRASSRDDLEGFARGLLAPLIEHDRSHGGELLRTLRAYLDEDRVQRRAAARCFVHVNTIVYRVRRIEETLGLDLGDPSTVFDLTLALRILDLLEDQPT